MSEQARSILRFNGHRYLVNRLVLSTLTGRPIRVSQIRSSSPTSPGLLPHEVSLLRLLEALTNGTIIEFSYTGTTVVYKPGLITGSAAGYGAGSSGAITHEIPSTCARGVSYFLLPLCLLAPFSKAPFNVLFTGPGVITSATSHGDISVDSVRTAILPLYAYFGIEGNIELRILRRSNAGHGGKGGGGEVQLSFGRQVRLPKTIHLLNPGRVKRVRGVAYATGLGGANNARMIESARGLLNQLVPDTYIFSDVSSAPLVPSENKAVGKDGKPAKRKVGIGFGISLVAETQTDVLYSADVASPPEGGAIPEDIGRQCALQLLEVIDQGGCASKTAASTMLILMAMGSEDVGRLQMGREVLGDKDIVQLARDLRTFGTSAWGLRDSPGDSNDVIVSVVGRGVGNVGRKIA
jgi:RNA 3'-terminal phosphate cyclase-like protein